MSEMSDEEFEAHGLKKPDPDEMKRLSIALLTLALDASTMEDRERAVQQYSADFAMVTSDLKNLEWVALVSMLANCGGALVKITAQMQDVEPSEMMVTLAELLNDSTTT